ncbi:hypothetical protein Gotur_034370 [Gossypium turneri]
MEIRVIVQRQNLRPWRILVRNFTFWFLILKYSCLRLLMEVKERSPVMLEFS